MDARANGVMVLVGLCIVDQKLKNEIITELDKLHILWCDDSINGIKALIVEQGYERNYHRYANAKIIMLMKKFEEYDCYYSMLLPTDAANVVNTLNGICMSEICYRKRIADILVSLNMPVKLKGYTYLTDIINIYVNNNNLMLMDVYKIIGLRFKTSPSNVERNVRYAIEVAFNECQPENQEAIFKNSINPAKGKATNMELIARIADMVKNNT